MGQSAWCMVALATLATSFMIDSNINVNLGVLERLVQLKVLFISPFGEAIQERSGLSLLQGS